MSQTKHTVQFGSNLCTCLKIINHNGNSCLVYFHSNTQVQWYEYYTSQMVKIIDVMEFQDKHNTEVKNYTSISKPPKTNSNK